MVNGVLQNGMIKELKQSEQNLFMNCIRLDMELEKNIQEFVAQVAVQGLRARTFHT